MRDTLTRVTDPRIGEIALQGTIPKLSDTPGGIRHLGVPLAAHNEAIYGEELGPHERGDGGVVGSGGDSERCIARTGIQRRFSDWSHTMINKASCLCASVTWEITTEPFQAFNCHCKQCRKAHGSAFGTYWFMRPEQFRWTSDTDTIVPLPFVHLAIRSFCGTCGSVVPYRSDSKNSIVSLGGCHDQGKKSDCNIFIAHNAPWHDVTGPLPRHDDYPPATGYPRVEEEPLPPGPEGVVRGSCMCGAVEFQPHRVVQGGAQLPLLAMPPGSGGGTRNQRTGGDRRGSFRQRRGPPEKLQAAGGKILHPGLLRYLRLEDAEDRPGARYRDRSPGALDDDPGMNAADHIFVASKCEWHDITDSLPVFKEGPAARHSSTP